VPEAVGEDRLVAQPKITVLTPSRNRGDKIARALRSVLDQNYSDVEHLILDGGSTDDTLDVVAGFPHAKVASRSDTGAQNAVNKGLALATGDIVGLLCTDDWYLPGAFAAVASAFATNPDLDAVAGKAVFCREGHTKAFLECRHGIGIEMGAEIMFGAPCLASWFIRRNALRELGGYCEEFGISADRDMAIKLWLRGRISVVPDALYCYEVHPGSRTLMTTPDANLEIAREHLIMSSRLSENPAVAPEVRNLASLWHDLEIARALNFAIKLGRGTEVMRILFAHFRQNPLWPVRAALAIRPRANARRLMTWASKSAYLS
jgi:glycosyltransferase involved in cell wall biosynthesis